MIDRTALLSRHDPIFCGIDYSAPLSVGNGELAFTADITGMQTLYNQYQQHDIPLCTMSQWGWHTTPVNKDNYSYSHDQVELTEYSFVERAVKYAVDIKDGNEDIYNWLRHNPHRTNLARIGLVWKGKEIDPALIGNINQRLYLYNGTLISNFTIENVKCTVFTACHFEKDYLGFWVSSEALIDGRLKIRIQFPYGHHSISASDWTSNDKHETHVLSQGNGRFAIERIMDKDRYYVSLNSSNPYNLAQEDEHSIELSPKAVEFSFSVGFNKNNIPDAVNMDSVMKSSKEGFRNFWNTSGMVDFSGSKDKRAFELERRIILSKYLLRIQSSGSMPPQETGLTCNSWYGKFHLEMHLWHEAYLPLWGNPELLEKSIRWYKDILPQAKQNAAKNGYKGARWPKMTAYEGIDSPSRIATLLIWQQPHIIYMLELIYKNCENDQFLKDYFVLIKETADFMSDFAVYNEGTKKYELVSPIIPVQEEHDPRVTVNPAFEVAYWRFCLELAVKWAERLGEDSGDWRKVAENMTDMPLHNGLYSAHANCPDTFEKYNKDHPSMLFACGLIPGAHISGEHMAKTLEKVLDCWDFASMWGWDFASMAMTATRLGNPDLAVDILMKEAVKNTYVASGNNYQKSRSDLPLYLPGNGGLLLAIALMLAGYEGCTEQQPGFPKNGMWDIKFEGIQPFPY